MDPNRGVDRRIDQGAQKRTQDAADAAGHDPPDGLGQVSPQHQRLKYGHEDADSVAAPEPGRAPDRVSKHVKDELTRSPAEDGCSHPGEPELRVEALAAAERLCVLQGGVVGHLVPGGGGLSAIGRRAVWRSSA